MIHSNGCGQFFVGEGVCAPVGSEAGFFLVSFASILPRLLFACQVYVVEPMFFAAVRRSFNQPKSVGRQCL